MATLEVVNLENEVVGQVKLHETVFAAKINKSLLYLAVKHHRDSLRQGTHATKTRAQVRGGGRKPWRQKGTGRARVGSSRNPLWRKGGVAHGPKPRSYAFHLPKKMLQSALRSALTDRFASDLHQGGCGFFLTQPQNQRVGPSAAKAGNQEKAAHRGQWRETRTLSAPPATWQR